MDDSRSIADDSNAERVFLEYLAQRAAGGAQDLDELCRAHPAEDAALRALAARWQLLERLRGVALAPGAADAHAGTGARAELDGLDRARRPIERYRVGDELARGAQGAIHRATDLDLDRELAMKVLHGGGPGSTSSRSIGRFLEEARVTAQLDHPGIVPIHDVGLDAGGRLFFTMKLVRGISMQDALARRGESGSPWSLARLVEALTRVADAMSFAHDRGVVHRDLKPSNVMLGGYGEVYVMDWGLARSPRTAASDGFHAHARTSDSAHGSSALTQAGDVVGTPHYMPPEQARGELDEVGPTADVYALGALLYHVLAGRAPYAHADRSAAAHEVLARLRAGPPEPLARAAPAAPTELAAICDKAMARASADRYADMRSLAADLRAWLEGRVVRAYESGAWPELKKWVRRNRALAAASAAALCAIVGGLAWSSRVESIGRRNAERAQARADATLVDLKRLSELRRLAELEERARTLWPPHPAQLGPLRAWLGAARELAAHSVDHERVLAELRSGSAPATGLEREWWQETLTELAHKLRDFAAQRIPDVERRIAFAESLEQRTLVEPRAAWDEARAIAASSDRYAGLALVPQLGLVPLGVDPQSQLLEFWHVQTGARPARGADGRIAPSDEMGVVLVLLPGGAFRFGAQATDPDAPNYDPAAAVDEKPILDLQLEPFLISKYELTQRQWSNLGEPNPSSYPAGVEIAGVTATWHNPQTNISWERATEVLARAALELPSEPQWEYAARAGTSDPWWTGRERESLRGAANIGDASAARAGANWPGLDEWPEFDDGFPLDAPVGRFRANAFGLHDVMGNVQEWCRDGYGLYPTERDASGSPRTRMLDTEGRFAPVIRGSSFGYGPSTARVARREAGEVGFGTNFLGVRPVLRLAR
ncbi:MAG: hypothetical protein EPO68_06765 [Planctomycetota bacterium]|nr:MAG: hypothetical protein EPO68_06765 [Planctomycetota bacterium]